MLPAPQFSRGIGLVLATGNYYSSLLSSSSPGMKPGEGYDVGEGVKCNMLYLLVLPFSSPYILRRRSGFKLVGYKIIVNKNILLVWC